MIPYSTLDSQEQHGLVQEIHFIQIFILQLILTGLFWLLHLKSTTLYVTNDICDRGESLFVPHSL